ncbi:DUF6520 family protein [Yeosuana marina]|uniref:DUF6520 family protein n=1 Tax=Yeosuana marina TaxID=1565536 RepID=UPI0030ECD100|tara:strand:- start:1110 stop:1358 length:249 start_codon:yes stop_codon:yes gene_type:complete
MKSKVFKIMLPAFAILLAISLSFATEATNSSQIGYYNDPSIPGIQQVLGGVDCPDHGEVSCEFNGFQVYADQALTIKLYERE